MEFADLISEFADKYHLEGLEVTDNIAAGLEIDGRNMLIMHDQEHAQVLVIGELGPVPEQGRQKIAETLLKANYLFIGTGGATLCLNPSSDLYELQLPIKLKDLTVDEFSTLFEEMIENLHTWWVLLADVDENAENQSDSQSDDAEYGSSNSLSSDLMMV